MKKYRRWSFKHNLCTICGTTKFKHYALGKCVECYFTIRYLLKKDSEKDLRAKKPKYKHIITEEDRLKMRETIKKRYDLTGQKFGKLTVLRRVGIDKFDNFLWECRCDCGGLKITRGVALRTGTSTQCGCVNRNVRHGMYGTRFYNI